MAINEINKHKEFLQWPVCLAFVGGILFVLNKSFELYQIGLIKLDDRRSYLLPGVKENHPVNFEINFETLTNVFQEALKFFQNIGN